MLAPSVAPQPRGTHLLMFKGFIPCAVLLFLFLLIQRIRLAVMIRHRPYAHHKIQLKAVSRLFKTATCRVVYARTECRYVNVSQPFLLHYPLYAASLRRIVCGLASLAANFRLSWMYHPIL